MLKILARTRTAAALLAALLGCNVLSAASSPTPPLMVCIDQNCKKTPVVGAPTASTTNATKWHPGWYREYETHVRGYPTVQYAPAQAEWTALPSYMSGMLVQFAWRAVETDYNVYDAGWLKQQLDYARAAGKRVFVDIWPQKIKPGSTEFPLDTLPPYLQNSPYGGAQTTDYGPMARIWRTEVADRMIALGAYLCRQFDSDPNFEGIMLPESSYALVGTQDPAFSQDALATQLMRIARGIREACPHTIVTSRWNWGTASQTRTMAAFAEQHALGIGTTDMSPTWISDMDLTLRGAGVVSTALETYQIGQNWGSIDYRGRIPIIGASEYPPFMKTTCMDQIVKYVNDVYKATHAMMVYQSSDSGAQACQQSAALLAAIQKQGPITNTACPASLTARGGCKRD